MRLSRSHALTLVFSQLFALDLPLDLACEKLVCTSFGLWAPITELLYPDHLRIWRGATWSAIAEPRCHW